MTEQESRVIPRRRESKLNAPPMSKKMVDKLKLQDKKPRPISSLLNQLEEFSFDDDSYNNNRNHTNSLHDIPEVNDGRAEGFQGVDAMAETSSSAAMRMSHTSQASSSSFTPFDGMSPSRAQPRIQEDRKASVKSNMSKTSISSETTSHMNPHSYSDVRLIDSGNAKEVPSIHAALALGLSASNIYDSNKSMKKRDEFRLRKGNSMNSQGSAIDSVDAMLMQIMVQETLMSVSSFPVLSSEQAQEKADQVKKMSDKIASLQNRIGLETAMREAALSLANLGGQDIAQVENAQNDLKQADAKIEKLVTELMNATTQLIEAERPYLKHLAAVLSWEINHSQKNNQLDEGKSVDPIDGNGRKVQQDQVSSLMAQVEELKSSSKAMLEEKLNLEDSLKKTEARLKEQEEVMKIRNSKKLSDARPKSKLNDFTPAEYNRLKLDLATTRADLASVKEDFAASRESISSLEKKLEEEKANVVSKDRTISDLVAELEQVTTQLETMSLANSDENGEFAVHSKKLASALKQKISAIELSTNVDSSSNAQDDSLLPSVRLMDSLNLGGPGISLMRFESGSVGSNEGTLRRRPAGPGGFFQNADLSNFDSQADTLRITPDDPLHENRKNVDSSPPFSGTLRRGMKLGSPPNKGPINGPGIQVANPNMNDSDTETEGESDADRNSYRRSNAKLPPVPSKDGEESIRSAVFFDASSEGHDEDPALRGVKSNSSMYLSPETPRETDPRMRDVMNQIQELTMIKEKLLSVQQELERDSGIPSSQSAFELNAFIDTVRKLKSESKEMSQQTEQLEDHNLHLLETIQELKGKLEQGPSPLQFESIQQELARMTSLYEQVCQELESNKSDQSNVVLLQDSMRALTMERNELLEKCQSLETELSQSYVDKPRVIDQPEAEKELSELRLELHKVKTEAEQTDKLFMAQAQEIESRHRHEIEQLKSEHAQEVNQLKQNSTVEKSRAIDGDDMKPFSDGYRDDLYSARSPDGDTIKDTSQEYIQRLVKEHQEQVYQLESKYAHEIENLKAAHAQEVDRMRASKSLDGPLSEDTEAMQQAHIQEIGSLKMRHIQAMEDMEQAHYLELNEFQKRLKSAEASVATEVEAERGRCQVLMQKLEDEVRALEREKDEAMFKLRRCQEELDSVLSQYRMLEMEVNQGADDHRISKIQREFERELMEKDQKIYQYHEDNVYLTRKLDEMESMLQSSGKSAIPQSDDPLLAEIDRLQQAVILLKTEKDDLVEDLEELKHRYDQLKAQF